jgi:phage-related protein
MKPVEFLGDSLQAIRSFPEVARRRLGYQIDKVQWGQEPDDWRPMPSVGPGVREIRVRMESGAFRVIYLAALEDAVYVLHAFQKKTAQTSKRDIEKSRLRLRELLRVRG